jgi:hypothetical protein
MAEVAKSESAQRLTKQAVSGKAWEAPHEFLSDLGEDAETSRRDKNDKVKSELEALREENRRLKYQVEYLKRHIKPDS